MDGAVARISRILVKRKWPTDRRPPMPIAFWVSVSPSCHAAGLAPSPESAPWRFGCAVLGKDPAAGEGRPGFALAEFDAQVWRAGSAAPRRYGFHATVKAWLRRRADAETADLDQANTRTASRARAARDWTALRRGDPRRRGPRLPRPDAGVAFGDPREAGSRSGARSAPCARRRPKPSAEAGRPRASSTAFRSAAAAPNGTVGAPKAKARKPDAGSVTIVSSRCCHSRRGGGTARRPAGEASVRRGA